MSPKKTNIGSVVFWAAPVPAEFVDRGRSDLTEAGDHHEETLAPLRGVGRRHVGAVNRANHSAVLLAVGTREVKMPG